jgi:aspartyl-tRNA(Asn)/glutamyl-tRNA(Gln) amidotransferase subunit B
VEIKNLNSFRNVQKALDYEFKRQIDLLENGQEVDQATLGFDPVEGQTFEMRTKEMADDYRYFPEPDIPPFALTDEYIEELKATLPQLPRERQHRYESEFRLKPYDAHLLASEKPFSEFFEAIVAEKPDYKAAANWMSGPIRSYLNDNAVKMEDFPLSPSQFAQIIQLIEDGKLNFSMASNTLFDELIKQPEKDPETLANELNLIQVGDDDFLMDLVTSVIQENPQKVEEYQNGKTGLLSFFMGQVMKKSKGKADPKKTNQLLEKELNKAEA